MTENSSLVVHAGAEKRFFIDMLTKDIELLPAIADLVDNSVDGIRSRAASSARGEEPVDFDAAADETQQDLAGYWIRLTLSGDSFEIVDNAGGMSADVARNYAFRFGRPRAFKGVPGSVGQFGIGMKRAIFKLGTVFEVESTWTNPERTDGSYFRIRADVDAWAEETGAWAFAFADLKESEVAAEEALGTRITVTSLRPSVSDDLALPATLDQLNNELSTRHQESLSRGMKITVNDLPLHAHRPALQSSDALRPVNRSFELSATAGQTTGIVKVQIVAGTVLPKNAAKDAQIDSEEARNFQNQGDAGWYVFCNDRLLLAGDRSAVTGWGSAAAAYHPQFRNFRGYVYMDADDASLLPWNTTKTAVDRESTLFREVASQMKSVLVSVQAMINRSKSESDRVRELQAAGVEDIPSTPLSSALASTPNVHIQRIPTSESLVAPPVPSFPPVPKSRPDTQRIQYQVDRDRYDRLADVFETKSGSDLGRITFEYVWKREVGD